MSNSNLALGTTETNIPVQLPSGNVRKALNLKDNPTNDGITIWLYGNIATYFNVAGLKNVSDYSLDGVTGISTISTEAATRPAAIYSLDGRQLKAVKKGINIVNGKKVLVK